MLEDDVADTQPTEPVDDLISKGCGLLAGHRDQGQRWSSWASYACDGVLGRKGNGIYGLADPRGCRVSNARAAVAVRAPSSVEQHRAGAGATGINGEEQFDCSARFRSKCFNSVMSVARTRLRH